MLKNKYIAPLLSLAAVGIVLIIALVMLFGNSTLAWFSNNGSVSGSGLNVTARGIPETEQYLLLNGVKIEEGGASLFEGLRPGDTVTVGVYVKNLTDRNIDLVLLMAAPLSSYDTPYVEGGKYHYFGTQIRFNSVKNGENELLSPVGIDRYLLTLDPSLYIDGGTLPPTSVSSAYDFSSALDKELTGTVQIPKGGEVTLDIKLEFVDNGTLQNAYIDFGNTSSDDEAKSSLSLTRTLVCSVSYSD